MPLKSCRLLAYNKYIVIAKGCLEWVMTVVYMSQRENNSKSPRISLRLSYRMKDDMSYHVCSSACRGLSSELRPQPCVQGQFGLRGGGSGGDPLSVMGQGHTMGALCQICWGCTAVGKGLALISVRMFTGVCHVWKLIRSATFPSHNHLRICICTLRGKKEYCRELTFRNGSGSNQRWSQITSLSLLLSLYCITDK